MMIKKARWMVKIMSIKTRLILSNLGMIIIPIFSILFIDIAIVNIMLFIFHMAPNENLQLFLNIRFISFLLVLIITIGVLTYFVSKSIIQPIQQLAEAAEKIAHGNLDFSLKIKGKDEISQLANSFETMRKKLKETKELNKKYEQNRRELIASISHDLKTPITSIKGYINGIKDGIANTPEKMERYINTIENKASELDHLIDELFLFSKLSLNKVQYHFMQFDLKDYLQDYIDELRFDLGDKNEMISLVVEGDLDYKVTADRNQLHRVMTNLIQNSLKYMDKETPKITVRLSSTNDFIKVAIWDNGSGIEKESLPFIFDQFYRTDASRNSSTGGSGIGLAIVKQIIEDHGGTVWAESEKNIGTSIFFTLPKAGENR